MKVLIFPSIYYHCAICLCTLYPDDNIMKVRKDNVIRKIVYCPNDKCEQYMRLLEIAPTELEVQEFKV